MIDPKDAPEGSLAVRGEDCEGCAFITSGICQKPEARCFASERKDGEEVIFISVIPDLREGVKELRIALQRFVDCGGVMPQSRDVENANAVLEKTKGLTE